MRARRLARARSRTCSVDSSALHEEAAGALRREMTERLEQQRALAHAGLSADQRDGSGDKTAAEHTVELPDAGGTARGTAGIDVGDGDGPGATDRQHERGRAGGRVAGVFHEGAPRGAVGAAAQPAGCFAATLVAAVSNMCSGHPRIVPSGCDTDRGRPMPESPLDSRRQRRPTARRARRRRTARSSPTTRNSSANTAIPAPMTIHASCVWFATDDRRPHQELRSRLRAPRAHVLVRQIGSNMQGEPVAQLSEEPLIDRAARRPAAAVRLATSAGSASTPVFDRGQVRGAPKGEVDRPRSFPGA